MRLSVFAACAAVMTLTCAAQALPPFSGTFVNGAPLNAAGLKGKVVVLYFYEEG